MHTALYGVFAKKAVYQATHAITPPYLKKKKKETLKANIDIYRLHVG